MKRIGRRRVARQGSAAGLTLIELLVVILILGMLATMVTTNVFNIFGESRIKTAETEVRSLVDIVGQYKLLRNKIPEDLRELTSGPKKWIKNVEAGEVPKDPWDREFRYAPDPNVEDGFVIWSLGEDPDDESDDIRSDRLGKSSSSEG